MNYRGLGKTNLMVSEIGCGCEWMERHTLEECKEVILACESHGINILDCWMPEPNVRSSIGAAIRHLICFRPPKIPTHYLWKNSIRLWKAAELFA